MRKYYYKDFIILQLQTVSGPINMNTLKNTLVYWKTLRTDDRDHGDIFAYRLIPFLRCCLEFV